MLVLGTGLTGLIGTRLTEILANTYQFEYIGSKNGIDILDKQKLTEFISNSNAQVVIHMAAKTNVDGCELDKHKDLEVLNFKNEDDKEQFWKREKTAYGVNVFGTQNIIEACKKTGKKIIYISTDFVFDGSKKHYSEEDIPNPLNWYAKTKYEAEKLVKESGLDFMIIRPAYPYRAYFERYDFVRILISKLKEGQSLQMVTDHIMVPTFIDDFIAALDFLIQKNESGIFHVVGSQTITPYEAAIKIADVFNLDKKLITKISRRDYFKDKAQRPFCLNLKNDKISKLGIEMLPFDQGLREIKRQMEKLNI